MTTRRISSMGLLLAAACACVMAGHASAANPALMAYERGIADPGKHSDALQIATLEVRIDVVGTIADTTVTAKFVNPGDDVLEGRFTLDLPTGAVVTGYALDVDEALIDGVLVDPLKARREYAERVRQNIDPGVAEVSRANRFSTTIYPIAPRSSRTIRLRFSAPIHPGLGFALPLATARPVGRFVLEVRASSVAAAPALTLPASVSADWRVSGSGFAANAAMTNKVLQGQLRLAPVTPSAKGLVTRHPNGTRMFQISDSWTPRAADVAPAAQRLRVYWDRSLSRRDDRLDDELAVLDKYLSQSKPASIDLVVFNSSGERVRRTAASEVAGVLRGVLYRGATSFAVLEKLEAPAADVCLVFSDGVVTIDPRRVRLPCQVFAISSAPDADAGYLARLTRAAGGAVLRLDRQSEAEILSRLRDTAPRVVEARGEDGSQLRIASLEAGPNGWLVVGERPEVGGVILRLAGLGNAVIERRYDLSASREERFAGAGALWAADRVALLGAEDGAREALVRLSRRFSVASPFLSFLVLEQPSDYVEADIAPPANYPREAMKGYREFKAERDAARRAAESERLAALIEQWEEQKEWWATKFEPTSKQKLAGPEQESIALTARSPSPAMAAPAVAAAAEDVSEIAVTGARVSRGAGAERPASITTELAEWSPDRPYLRALDAASPGELDRVLAREERRNGMLPAFYFDVAEWLYRRKRVEAVEMLLSALELSVANEETASMVADRLLRYGRVDRAIWLYERADEQSNYLPQPKRTLALALARRAARAPATAARADLRRAVELLNEVIITPWEGSFDGIEMVALMEVNSLLPRLRALGEEKIPLDPRLRALLDLDIRVVIEWNTGATDMDLWVDEPGGERAIYSHPRTAIGGRLSNDMTQGYGPEEYLLRRAVPGEYRISVNVYSSDSINPNGTTVVTARLLRNFGRADQHEETMELELKPEEQGEKLIGRFTVK
jgi:hypothetical protein